MAAEEARGNPDGLAWSDAAADPERAQLILVCDIAHSVELLLTWLASSGISLDALPPTVSKFVAELRMDRLDTEAP